MVKEQFASKPKFYHCFLTEENCWYDAHISAVDDFDSLELGGAMMTDVSSCNGDAAESCFSDSCQNCTLANQVAAKVLNFSLLKCVRFGARLLIESPTDIFCILSGLYSPCHSKIKGFCGLFLKAKIGGEHFCCVLPWPSVRLGIPDSHY